MRNQTIYLSYPSVEREHALAVSKLVRGLGYTCIESSPRSQLTANICGMLLRIRAREYAHDSTTQADTRAFLGDGRSPEDGSIVDLVLAPGYTVWPEKASCPVFVVNAVTQAYSNWVHDLEQALAGALMHPDPNYVNRVSAIGTEDEGQYHVGDLEDVEDEYDEYDNYIDDNGDFEANDYNGAGFLEYPDDF